MNAKEHARMRRIELENAQLREKNDRHIEVYRDQLLELIELRSMVELLRELIND